STSGRTSNDTVRFGPDMKSPLVLLFMLLVAVLAACSSPPGGTAKEVGLDDVREGTVTALWLNGLHIDRARGLASGEMERAEDRLSRIAHRVPAPLAEYRRQYAGVVVGGQKAVLLSATHEGRRGVAPWFALFDAQGLVTLHIDDSQDPRARASSPGALGESLLVQQACDMCHRLSPETTIGVEFADAQGPDLWNWVGTARPLASGDTVLADVAYMRESVFAPARQIARGYPDGMPSYDGKLDSLDVEAMGVALRCLSADPPPDVMCG
ncbi:MAG: hypothetical protein AAFQ43_00065, partial [Bacteroidota bacterium]